MKGSCLTALPVLSLLLLPLAAQQAFVLTDGTPVRVRLNRTVSSVDAKVGETVDFDMVDDVLVNGAVVIQRGSRVLATVTEAQPKGLMGKSGKLNVSLDHARSILGERIALRAVKESDRGASGSNIVTVATSIVTAPLLPFMKGKDVTIPKGTEVTAYVHGDIRLDEGRIRAHSMNASKAGESAAPTGPTSAAAPAVAPPAQTVAEPAAAPPAQTAPAPQPRAAAPPPASGMTNADVVALKTAGFSDDLIVSKIKSSRCAFRLETKDMIDLKMAGLSDRVIGAMMEKTQ